MRKSLVQLLAPAFPIVIVVLGLMLISVGIALIYIPAGIIVLGIEFLIFEYYLRARGR